MMFKEENTLLSLNTLSQIIKLMRDSENVLPKIV